MLRSSWKPLRKWETPSLSVLSVKSTPASIGDYVTVDICFQSKTTTVPITISKMGQLTFPISGYRCYGLPCTPWTSLSKNSPVSSVSSHYQNSLALRIPYKFINNFQPTIQSPWTNGCLWIFSPFWKYRRHQQNHRVAGTQRITFMDVVLLWALSTNHEEIGRRNAIPERLCWGLTCGTTKTQNRRSLMPTSRWGKTIRPMSHALCTTCVTNHHQTSSLRTCSTDRYDH